jgi:hypothetical protein
MANMMVLRPKRTVDSKRAIIHMPLAAVNGGKAAKLREESVAEETHGEKQILQR